MTCPVRVQSIINAFSSRSKNSNSHHLTQPFQTKVIKAMAVNTTTQPILIDSDEEFYGSDEEKEHIMGPATKAATLPDAINSASKDILVKTLLEICEHNEASKELATALLAPPNAPLSPRGTKRKASPTESSDRMCERCGGKFGEGEQITKNCRYHPGKLCFATVAREFGSEAD